MKHLYIIVLLLVSLSLQGQTKNKKALDFTVQEAPEWNDLFNRDSGWFGGDGIFAIPLNGKENMEPSDTTKNIFIFSDTMFGQIKDGLLQPGYKMVNNSIAILDGHEPDKSKMEFKVLMDSAGNPTSLFIPKTPQTEKGCYFWLGDGFVNTVNNALYIFAYKVINIPDQKIFGFKVFGSVLIKIPGDDTFPFPNQSQSNLPLLDENSALGEGNMGCAIFVNTKEANVPNPDGYIYIYGVRGEKKSLVVARVLPENFENFNKWTYWSGNSWTTTIENMSAIADGVSNELSISPIPGGKYALVFQLNTLSGQTGMRISDSPIGPFSETYILHDCANDLVSSNFFAYNAKAYPSLSKPGELLISYNINSFDFFEDIKQYPNLYRPRFFKVIFK